LTFVLYLQLGNRSYHVPGINSRVFLFIRPTTIKFGQQSSQIQSHVIQFSQLFEFRNPR